MTVLIYAPTRGRELTGNKWACLLASKNPTEAGTDDAVRKASWARTVSCAAHTPKEVLIAHSGLGDFGDRDGFDSGTGAESEAKRPPIPTESGHRFRSKAATRSGRRQPPC